MNDRVNPIFKSTLAKMAGMIEPQEFDEFDEALIHDVCEGPTLGNPIQALLITYRQIKLSQDSFGPEATNAKAAMDALMPLLKALRTAVREKWERGQ